MRRSMLRSAAAGVCLAWVAGAAWAAPGIPWGKSLSQAETQAKKSNKLVMLDFYTDW